MDLDYHAENKSVALLYSIEIVRSRIHSAVLLYLTTTNMAKFFSVVKIALAVFLLGNIESRTANLFNWSYKDFGTIAFNDASPAQRQQLATYPTVSCPDGWVHFADSCYYVEEETLGFAQAEKKCFEKNSSLLVVNSEEEWNVIREFTPKAANSWIGLVRFTSVEKFENAPKWQTESAINPSQLDWLVRPYDAVSNGWSILANCVAHFNPIIPNKDITYSYYYPCSFKFASICERNSTILEFLNRKFDFHL